MAAKNASKTILSVRTLVTVLAAVFAALAAGCAPTDSSPGPVLTTPSQQSN